MGVDHLASLCIIVSDEDCQQSVVCLTQGRCHVDGGQCRSATK